MNMKRVECYRCGKKSNIFTRPFYKRDVVIGGYKWDKPKLVYNCPRCNREIEKAFNEAFKE